MAVPPEIVFRLIKIIIIIRLLDYIQAEFLNVV